MIDFTRGGKRYVAGRGFFSVFDAASGNKILSAIDVFREKDPTPEMCIELNNVLTKIVERQEKKPKQRKAITKDPF